MTAEIAILNKSAIALAADSAVTISVGSSQKKIFDSDDKLFELSCHDPIAVMINSNMHFMETPFQVIVKKFRLDCPRFKNVEDAALGFLQALEKFGSESPREVKKRSLYEQISPLVASLQSQAETEFSEIMSHPSTHKDKSLEDIKLEIATGRINFLVWLFDRAPEAEFLGKKRPKISVEDKKVIKGVIENEFPIVSEEQAERLVDLISANVHKLNLFQETTGVVIAGYGQDDLFPTLVEFRIAGMVGGALKFQTLNKIDIDRNGERARVIPFAQRDMVERFLYGIDRDIERKIKVFCQRTVQEISNHLLGQMEIDEQTSLQLIEEAMNAEKSFVDGLQKDGFAGIRKDSQSEIEDMVEFMPKSEMARMAEALVNLTSIKRRVSPGMETVGGPIDVAIISKSEGFVWVKRKHYFPPELNARYFERISN